MLKLTMIKILKKQGWLVVAAALIIVLSACTKEDMVNGAQAQDDSIQAVTGASIDAKSDTWKVTLYGKIIDIIQKNTDTSYFETALKLNKSNSKSSTEDEDD